MQTPRSPRPHTTSSSRIVPAGATKGAPGNRQPPPRRRPPHLAACFPTTRAPRRGIAPGRRRNSAASRGAPLTRAQHRKPHLPHTHITQHTARQRHTSRGAAQAVKAHCCANSPHIAPPRTRHTRYRSAGNTHNSHILNPRCWLIQPHREPKVPNREPGKSTNAPVAPGSRAPLHPLAHIPPPAARTDALALEEGLARAGALLRPAACRRCCGSPLVRGRRRTWWRRGGEGGEEGGGWGRLWWTRISGATSAQGCAASVGEGRRGG